MTNTSLLSQDQFSLLGIVIAVAAYTVVVRQFLDQKIGKITKKHANDSAAIKRPKPLHLAFLDHTREFLIAADALLVMAGCLLVMRIFFWARGQGAGLLWDWLDLDRLILAQAGVTFLFLAGLHVRALMYRLGWIYHRKHSGRSGPSDDMSSETIRRVAEKLEQHRSS